MKEKNIQELAIRMGLISVEDMCQYTIAQLVVMVANKVNELVDEVWRFETDVQEILKTQNENIQYLLGEGLHLEVGNIFDEWVQDGTFDTLINQTALKKVNDRIDETNAQLSQSNNVIENTNTTLEKSRMEFKDFTLGTLISSPSETFVAYDGFERENGSALGSLELGTSKWYTGGTGTWSIQDGHATASGHTNYALAYVGCWESDCMIEVDIKNVHKADKCGIACRVVDENNFLFVGVNYEGHIGLYRNNNGNITAYKGVQLKNGRTFTDGKITVIMRGENFKIFYDGFLQLDVDLGVNPTATKHGLIIGSSDDRFNKAVFDNFKITKAVTYPLSKNIRLDMKGKNLPWYWGVQKDETKDYSQQFINDQLRIEIRRSDNLVVNAHRSELSLESEQACESHIYSFDIKLSDVPGEFERDLSPEILAQWHGNANPDGSHFSAPLSLMARSGNFIIDINWDNYYKTDNNQITSKGNNASINLGAYELGRWYNFTFKVKWGWHESLNPMLEVYQDGILVVNRPCMPNCMNNKKGNYFKIGIYKYDWTNPNTQTTTDKRVVYYRNVYYN